MKDYCIFAFASAMSVHGKIQKKLSHKERLHHASVQQSLFLICQSAV